MLEKYYVQPKSVDRIRASWIGAEVERYVVWLSEREYSSRSILRRVPILVKFGEFARAAGARTVSELSAHVEAFVMQWVSSRRHRRCGSNAEHLIAKEIRGPLEQMLRLVVADFEGTGRPRRTDLPLVRFAPKFFDYLCSERGLRPTTVVHYRYHLIQFEAYMARMGIVDLNELSPTHLSAFVADRRASGLAKTSIRSLCGVLRVFLRYAHREDVISADLSETVEWPQAYRLSTIPRSISWSDVQKVLDTIDRRSSAGKRDYAILLLLVTYGLRAREVAALTLDDIDWKRERLRIPERKAAHSTAFPLSTVVGDALVDYLQHGRPQTTDRHVFFRVVAPFKPLGGAAISSRARRYLLAAEIDVPRPGSHTLRHTCVQRLIDAGFPLKTIGDFVGHRAPASTEIYGKVAVEKLREVALGDGEEVLV